MSSGQRGAQEVVVTADTAYASRANLALMTEPALQPRGVRGIASKLHEDHLQRLAIVHVRQSHPQPIVEHVESTARPYALVVRAVALGWSRDRVVVIDEDQGQSGQSMVTRLGFQRGLAEVSLDHVGLILGLEMSRLAHPNKDWHPWLELCAIFRTLLAEPMASIIRQTTTIVDCKGCVV